MEKKKCFMMYDGNNRGLMPFGYFDPNVVYEFVAESSGENSQLETGLWETTDKSGHQIKVDQLALQSNFHKPAPDTMYLVRQYIDRREKGTYGVDDVYCLVGLFSDMEMAFHVRDKALSTPEKNQDEDQEEKVDVLGVTPNRFYQVDRPFLGGGYYQE